MKRLFFLAVILVLLASCSSTERVSYSQSTLDSFVGQTHEELVQKLGAPTESVPDGGEGYILVYEGKRIFSVIPQSTQANPVHCLRRNYT